MLAAPRTKLFEIELAFHLLFIFGRVIIPPLAHGAAEGNEVF